MKKFIVLFMMVLAMMSCADSKTFERADGTKFVAEPYGWANYQSNKIEGVTYEACFENIVWDRKDYPEVFRDDAGLDISIPGFITRGSWIRNNSPRTVTLDVTTYRGVSCNAVHYYGNITIEGVSFSPEDRPNIYTMCKETYEAEEKNPLAAGFYRIELVRPVTSEEIEEDSSRWSGYEVGDNTNAFYSPEDVIALAKEVCKARFLGNWKLKIVDYSGKDLDSEILISEL